MGAAQSLIYEWRLYYGMRVGKEAMKAGPERLMYFDFFWTDEILAHLAEHGISQADFERVVKNPERIGTSRSSGHPAAWGYTRDGRYIITVYEKIDFSTVVPVTAYEVPEPHK